MLEVNDTVSIFEKIQMKTYDSLFALSIAKEAINSKSGNSGVIIIGMIIVIVGIIGFILTKNKN